MKKMSQKELIAEGFSDVLRSVGKGAVKMALPETSALASSLKGKYDKLISSSYPSSFIKGFPKQMPETVAGVTNIKENKIDNNLATVSFSLIMRNPNSPNETMDPVGPITLNFKRSTEGGWIPASDPGNIMDEVQEQIAGNPELKASMVKFQQQLFTLQSELDKQEADQTKDQSAEDTRQDDTSSKSKAKVAAVPPKLPATPPLPKKLKQKIVGRSRSGSSKRPRSENEESYLNQKSLLEHLQSWSR